MDNVDPAAAAAGAPEEERRVDGCSRTLEKFLAQTTAGHALEAALPAVSLLSCLVYFVETYFGCPDYAHALLFTSLEAVFCAYFLFDYALRVVASKRKLEYVLSIGALFDLVTALPIAFRIALSAGHAHHMHAAGSRLLVGVLRTLRILRVTRVFRLLVFVPSEISRQIWKMLTTVLAIIFVGSGVMHILESEPTLWRFYQSPSAHSPCGRPFHDYMYLTVTTITTVGYGDISPGTTPGRIFMMCLLACTVVVLPMETNKLIETINSRSVYGRQRYVPVNKGGGSGTGSGGDDEANGNKAASHVLVCGDMRDGGVQEFFTELFHDDHGHRAQHAVVISPGAPSAEMARLLNHPRFSLCVTYIEGSVFNARDLIRAGAASAKAVFVMTNKFSSSPANQDAATVMYVYAVRRFVRLHAARVLDVHVQLIKPASKQLYLHNADVADRYRAAVTGKRTGPSSGAEELNCVVCVEEIKMQMLARSCLHPGVSTMLANLISSDAFPAEAAESGDADAGAHEWMAEYQSGCELEIYRVPLSPDFEGFTFLQCAQLIYRHKGCVAFALDLHPPNDEKKVFLNPGRFVVPNVRVFQVNIFMLAEDMEDAEIVSSVKLVSSEPTHPLLELQREKETVKRARTMSRIEELNAAQATGQLKGKAAKQAAKEAALLRRQASGASGASQHGTARRGIEWSIDFLEVGEDDGEGSAVEPFTAKPGESEPEGGADSLDLEGSAKAKMDPTAGFINAAGRVRTLEEATITSLRKDLPDVKGHVLFIGNTESLLQFVRPLRGADLTVPVPIVILCEEEPSRAMWEHEIGRFAGIYFIKGSGLDVKCLSRAAVRMASQVIILARDFHVEADAQRIEDAETIFVYRIVTKETRDCDPPVPVMCEIVSRDNIAFLSSSAGAGSGAARGKDGTESKGDRSSGAGTGTASKSSSSHARARDLEEMRTTTMPLLASGTVFTSSMLDTLQVQAYYNPHILDVLNHLLSGGCTPLDIGIDVLSSEADDDQIMATKALQAVSRSSSNAEKRHAVATLLSRVQQSHLVLVPVPTVLFPATVKSQKLFGGDTAVAPSYGDLFNHLVTTSDQIPLGLFRGVHGSEHAGAGIGDAMHEARKKRSRKKTVGSHKDFGNSKSYVYTNPESSVKVRPCDRVFVLRPAPAGKKRWRGQGGKSVGTAAAKGMEAAASSSLGSALAAEESKSVSTAASRPVRGARTPSPHGRVTRKIRIPPHFVGTWSAAPRGDVGARGMALLQQAATKLTRRNSPGARLPLARKRRGHSRGVGRQALSLISLVVWSAGAYVSSMHLADSMQSRPQQLSMLALLALFYNAVLTAFFAVLELLTLSGCFAPTGALRRCCCTAANDSTRLGIAAVLLLWTGAVEVATRSDMGAVVGCAGMLCALPHVLLAAGAD